MTFAHPRENVYGSIKRLEFIKRVLRPGDRIVEIGCGTGYMVTMPLLVEGRDVLGVDLDVPSIELGRSIARESGLDPDRLVTEDLRTIDGLFDVAILSEVLEHQTDEQMDELLGIVRDKLAPGGRLVVTVPNGRGLYEAEAFLYKRLGLGHALERAGIAPRLLGLRHRTTGGYDDAAHPSTLDHSPHLQQFSFRSVQERVRRAGFDVTAATGSVLVAGQFTNLLVTGHRRLMGRNRRLGDRFPRAAAGFYVAAVKRG